MSRNPLSDEDQAEQVALGQAIARVRERRGMQKQELAAALGLDASAVTHIEAGSRSVSSTRLNALARALGVSVLALLDDDSPLAEIGVAARTGSDLAVACEIADRATALVELADVLQAGQVPSMEYPEPPAVRAEDWDTVTALALARWALDKLGLRWLAERPADMLDLVEDRLGIDVHQEPFDGGPDGFSACTPSERLIVLNTGQAPRPSLFTLGHEIGHVLSRAHVSVCDATSFRSADPHERLANAVAAELVAPSEEMRERFPAAHSGDVDPDGLVRAYVEFGISYQALVYRLHNIGRVNAAGRDRLLAESVGTWARRCSDPNLSRRASAPATATRVYRASSTLLDRLAEGYRRGVVSIRPYAGLARLDPGEAMSELDLETALEFGLRG